MSTTLITGANRGIGKALAEIATAKGEHVIGTARTTIPAALDHAADWFRLDVTQPQDFKHLAEALDGQRLDRLICNAGIYHDKGHNLADGYGADLWAETFAVNVTGVFQSVQAVLANLQLSETPQIAIISSRMGSNTLAPGGSYIYRASKAAALNLGRNLAVDLAPLNIAVGIYHPGWVQTDMGGQAADIEAGIAAAGLWQQITSLDVTTSGAFKSYDGEDLPV